METIKRQANMSRDERKQEIEERQSVVDGMLRWIHESKRELTEKEREKIQHHRNVISSLKLGLENELKGAE
ncbi:MAG: hypothetical protein WBQ10_15005 [Terriglobales bacterium]